MDNICRKCGGTLVRKDYQTLACEYCGTEFYVIIEDTSVQLNLAYLNLEDGNFDEARAICNKILCIDTKNAEAYVCKLLANLRLQQKSQLVNITNIWEIVNDVNYTKAMQYADEKLKKELYYYFARIRRRNEKLKEKGIFAW